MVVGDEDGRAEDGLHQAGARPDGAGTLLGTKDVDRIPELLGEHLMIHEATEGRRLFHATEMLAYQHVVGLYLIEIGEYEAAEVTLESIEALDPSHPTTRELRSQLRAARSSTVGAIKGLLRATQWRR